MGVLGPLQTLLTWGVSVSELTSSNMTPLHCLFALPVHYDTVGMYHALSKAGCSSCLFFFGFFFASICLRVWFVCFFFVFFLF